MKKLTSADSLVTISHYRNVLESEGIRCQIRNQHLSPLAGEIPFVEVWPELWVVNDLEFDRARQLIDEAVSGESPTDPWRCSHCGEENEGQFAACWNCSRPA